VPAVEEPRPLDPVDLIFAVVGMALHGVLLVLILVSGLVAPFWAVAGLFAVWLALLLYGLMTWRRRRWMTIATPLVGFGCWLLVIFVGGEFLGWTA